MFVRTFMMPQAITGVSSQGVSYYTVSVDMMSLNGLA